MNTKYSVTEITNDRDELVGYMPLVEWNDADGGYNAEVLGTRVFATRSEAYAALPDSPRLAAA